MAFVTTYLRNRIPSHAIEYKTPHEMWFGQLPLVRHLKVFGSTYHGLIPKEQINKLGARRRRCILLGYSRTSSAYRLYDEVNKKFVVSRDVIFLETNKTLQGHWKAAWSTGEIFHLKTYYEFDKEIPKLEGGILILDRDQYLEFPFEAPTPPHEEIHEEEVPTTSLEYDDVIDRILRLNLEENVAPPADQPGPSKKIPK